MFFRRKKFVKQQEIICCSSCKETYLNYDNGIPKNGTRIIISTGYGLYYDPPSGDIVITLCADCSDRFDGDIMSLIDEYYCSDNKPEQEPIYDWALDVDMNEDFAKWSDELRRR